MVWYQVGDSVVLTVLLGGQCLVQLKLGGGVRVLP